MEINAYKTTQESRTYRDAFGKVFHTPNTYSFMPVWVIDLNKYTKNVSLYVQSPEIVRAIIDENYTVTQSETELMPWVHSVMVDVLFKVESVKNKINLIKEFRASTGLGLKESKDIVEAWLEETEEKENDHG